jgi:hypothetical protein
MVRPLHVALAAGILALAGGGVVAAIPRGPAVSGVVVDAVSGRVAAGVEVVYGGASGTVLNRFRSPDFAFRQVADDGRTLSATAPGYRPVSIEVHPGATGVRLALQPVEIPDLGGVLVFPRADGGRLDLTAQLLDGRGAVLPEFPAVPLTARLVAEGAGAIPLDLRADWSGPEIRLPLSVSLEALSKAFPPGSPAGYLVVEVKAGDKVVTSRPFAAPQGAALPAE